MTAHEAGKGDAPRKQQDQKAYEEGWDRIFKRREDRPLTDSERKFLEQYLIPEA